MLLTVIRIFQGLFCKSSKLASFTVMSNPCYSINTSYFYIWLKLIKPYWGTYIIIIIDSCALLQIYFHWLYFQVKMVYSGSRFQQVSSLWSSGSRTTLCIFGNCSEKASVILVVLLLQHIFGWLYLWWVRQLLYTSTLEWLFFIELIVLGKQFGRFECLLRSCFKKNILLTVNAWWWWKCITILKY